MKNTQYLLLIKHRWYCRVRWPKEVWGTLGRGFFKKSLGTDCRSEAITRLPGALQEFQSRVAKAKAHQLESAPRRLGAGEITLLVSRWFEQAQGAFQPSTKPRQFDPQERQERRALLERQDEQLSRKRAQLGEGDYSTLYPIVDGLLSRAGLNVDREDPSFGLLCQTLMRAWIALEETALAKMRGEFGYQPTDPILEELKAEPGGRAEPAAKTLEDLIGAYEAAKADRWSQSTKNAYKPVYRVLRDTLGANRDVRSVDREAAREVFETVKGLPRNLGKNADLAKLPVPAAVAAARSLGLLERNAGEVKSGAGQYFTPRALIQAMVEVVDPEPGETVCDPACGTGGFLLAAYEHMKAKPTARDRRVSEKLRRETFRGYDIVPEVVRLCAMNLYLHGIGGDTSPVLAADALLTKPTESWDIILANPPFGKRQSFRIVNDEGGIDTERQDYVREDFTVTTGNKQLNFVQHIMSVLGPKGTAAVVLPDNVLFEGGAGEALRQRLLTEFNFHTLLRLSTLALRSHRPPPRRLPPAQRPSKPTK